MLSVFLLCWAVLRLHTPSTCHPLQRASSQHDATTGHPEVRTQDKFKITTSNYFMEKKSNESVWKTIPQRSQGIFSYMKKISVLHVKSNMFLCLDSKAKFYTSVTDASNDCHFHINKRRKHFDVLHSHSGDVIFILKSTKESGNDLGSSDLSNFVLLKRKENIRHRRKRHSWTIDPSDPLGCEYPELRTIHNLRREPQWASKVSKETITSNDDPLQVLLSDSPVSPIRERDRVHRKVRF